MDLIVLLALLSLLIWYLVVAVIAAVSLLMLLRLLMNYSDMNPFGWPALTIRRFSDPLIMPVRTGLARAGLDPKFAPLVTILIAILLGWFANQLAGDIIGTVGGVYRSARNGSPVSLVGYLLYGVLAVYALLIFMRIVFSWGASQYNRVLRFLVRATDPILTPFRRLIPPVGIFDISPIIVLLLLELLQKAVAGTLIRS